MRKLQLVVIIGLMVALLLPSLAMASGDKASALIVVADTRMITETDSYHTFMRYLADAYNTNILVFAIWCTVLTALYGVTLGFLMDFLMARTGLDLKSRKIIEH
jgi:ABC-type Fe3+ transport system permease subunit